MNGHLYSNKRKERKMNAKLKIWKASFILNKTLLKKNNNENYYIYLNKIKNISSKRKK